MKIKLTQALLIGTATHNKGGVVDVPQERAKRLMLAGHATPVREVETEQAVKKPATEKAKK